MVRMDNYSCPLRTLVYIFYNIQQTRIHRNVVHVVDRQLHQHDEMEKTMTIKKALIVIVILILLSLAAPSVHIKATDAGGLSNSTPAAPSTVLLPETTTTPIDLSFLNTTTSTTVQAPPTVPEYRNIESPTSPNWDLLAQCETNGNWAANTGNGFAGGLQFAHQPSWSSWEAYQGTEYAPNPWEATREQQIIVAERILNDVGWKAWPHCSRLLGFT